MSLIRLAVLTPVSGNGESGGAERLYEGLVAALNFDSVQTDQIQIRCDEATFDSIAEAYVRCRDLDLSGYDGVISTKAPTYVVRHPNHVCYLVHTMRVFYDMFDAEFRDPPVSLQEQRALIQKMDTLAFSRLSDTRRLCIGHTVRKRQELYNGLAFDVLHPPLCRNEFQFQTANEPFAFLPGRLHRWKRVDLIIRALRQTRSPLQFLIAGDGEDRRQLESLAAGDPRIRFLGRISDPDLIRLYSTARVVPFAPVREDYGYVTIEAFRSGKPVITCTDSGEPAHFVADGQSGFVCPPDPAAIAERLDWFYDHPAEAAAMGARGFESVAQINWVAVRLKLLAALGF